MHVEKEKRRDYPKYQIQYRSDDCTLRAVSKRAKKRLSLHGAGKNIIIGIYGTYFLSWLNKLNKGKIIEFRFSFFVQLYAVLFFLFLAYIQ